MVTGASLRSETRSYLGHTRGRVSGQAPNSVCPNAIRVRSVRDQVPKAHDRRKLRLDPTRPLWQVHVIDGPGDGAALLLRTHHAMADGPALVHVLHALDDQGAQSPPTIEPGPGFELGFDVAAMAKLVAGI